jgi:hypothetical protein
MQCSADSEGQRARSTAVTNKQSADEAPTIEGADVVNELAHLGVWVSDVRAVQEKPGVVMSYTVNLASHSA